MRIPKRMQGVKKAAHARSPKQEKELALRHGGKVVKGSGCGFEKGDVRFKNKVLLEAKCTEKKSFSITRKMVQKIQDAACGNGEVPVIQIEFIDDKGVQLEKICVCPSWVLDELLSGS